MGRSRFAALMIAAAVFLAACGGGNDDLGVDPQAAREAEATEAANATREDIEACSLLTVEEAGELLGATVTSVEPMVIRVFSACEWVNDATLPVKALQVGIFDLEVDSDLFQESAGAGGSVELEEVAGIADEAYWTGLGQLYIRNGSLMVSIFPSRDGGREQAIAAAELVVPRLD